jgi:precorrin-6A/cobalt-precorrin-6A reductase
MAQVSHLLILGGTAEALTLAKAASSLAGLDVVTSLAGRTAAPRRPDGGLRIGGFGGIAGLARYLGEAKINLVIDATHPFANLIAAHAWGACQQRGVPFLRLLRAPWTPQPGDRWIDVADAAAAARALSAQARRVFLAIGKKDIAAFAGLSDRWFLFRSVDPLAGSLPFAGLAITDRGPFHTAAEQALLSAHRIDAVVSRNSGGEGSAAKLEAARALDLPVVMIRRPATLDAPMVHTVDDALFWLRGHLV